MGICYKLVAKGKWKELTSILPKNNPFYTIYRTKWGKIIKVECGSVFKNIDRAVIYYNSFQSEIYPKELWLCEAENFLELEYEFNNLLLPYVNNPRKLLSIVNWKNDPIIEKSRTKIDRGYMFPQYKGTYLAEGLKLIDRIFPDI